ncbi:MAG TPA: HAD-IA family hydrolase [Thermodesulfobacteriota bacterium]
MTPRYDAIAFDLLTALVDSWTLYTAVTGDEAVGRAWRTASLRIVTAAGDYRPYEDVLREAAAEVGLAPSKADELIARWGEIRPWPEVPGVLARLADRRLAVLTNCSQRLADIAAAATGGRFELVLSAERAGVYKTDPRSYRALLDRLGLPADRVLFVAGSAHDVKGAPAVGMPVYWQNRARLPVPEGAPPPLVDAPDLTGLLSVPGV